MAAPGSRRLRNQTAPVVHTRREWVLAIGGSALVVLVTVVLIWAMRPGSPNSLTEGKGGLIHRQPRMALWLLATVAATAIASWLILRPESKVRKPLRALAFAISGVVIVAVATLGVWHNNLVHDYAVPTTIPPPTSVPPISTTVPSASTTIASGSTTLPPPTTAPTATTAAPTATTAAAPTTAGG